MISTCEHNIPLCAINCKCVFYSGGCNELPTVIVFSFKYHLGLWFSPHNIFELLTGTVSYLIHSILLCLCGFCDSLSLWLSSSFFLYFALFLLLSCVGWLRNPFFTTQLHNGCQGVCRHAVRETSHLCSRASQVGPGIFLVFFLFGFCSCCLWDLSLSPSFCLSFFF